MHEQGESLIQFLEERMGKGEMKTRKQGNTETGKHGDKETRKQGNTETRKQGKRETRRQGDKETSKHANSDPTRPLLFEYFAAPSLRYAPGCSAIPADRMPFRPQDLRQCKQILISPDRKPILLMRIWRGSSRRDKGSGFAFDMVLNYCIHLFLKDNYSRNAS
jgi:hypothetical protein